MTTRQEKPAISLENLQVYYRGGFFSTVTLKRSLAKIGSGAREALQAVDNHQQMLKKYQAALEQTILLKKQNQKDQNQSSS